MRAKDHLTIGMSLEIEKPDDHDELRAFDDKAIVKQGVLDASEFNIVAVKKLGCAICVVNDTVELPARKDKHKRKIPYRHEGLVVYRKREIALLKSRNVSPDALKTIHVIKDLFGGEVLAELSKPPVKFVAKVSATENRWGRTVKSTDPIKAPNYIKAPTGSITDPTQDEMSNLWKHVEDHDDCEYTETHGSEIPIERADDDGWYR